MSDELDTPAGDDTEAERLRRRLERRSVPYADRKRGTVDRSTEETIEELRAAGSLTRNEQAKRDERNIGLWLSNVVGDERELKALARLIDEGEIPLEAIDGLIDDYMAALPPEDRLAPGDLDRASRSRTATCWRRARIVEHALAHETGSY